MKKLIGLCLLGLVAFVAASCSDNDRIYDGVNNSYVKYEVTVSQHLYKYYDVQGTFAGFDNTWATVKLDGNTHTEKFQKTGEDVGKITPQFEVTGTRNSRSLSDIDEAKSYTVTNGFKISYYSPTATAKNMADTTTSVMSGAKLKEYINNHPTLTFASYNY